MSHKRRGHLTPHQWMTALFRQPPQGFYHRPAIYLSGDVMEIEHFKKILLYDSSKLCLAFPHGRFTVYGDELRICTLTAHRITLRGRILRTDFSDD